MICKQHVLLRDWPAAAVVVACSDRQTSLLSAPTSWRSGRAGTGKATPKITAGIARDGLKNNGRTEDRNNDGHCPRCARDTRGGAATYDRAKTDLKLPLPLPRVHNRFGRLNLQSSQVLLHLPMTKVGLVVVIRRYRMGSVSEEYDNVADQARV